MKIDGLFVCDMLNDFIDFVLVKVINDISCLFDKCFVVEYVENKEIFLVLKEIGIDYG